MDSTKAVGERDLVAMMAGIIVGRKRSSASDGPSKLRRWVVSANMPARSSELPAWVSRHRVVRIRVGRIMMDARSR